MIPNQLFKQMTDFNRVAFNNAFNAMVMFQDQAEKMTQSLMDKSPLLPKEAAKAMEDWLKTYKQGREQFKSFMDENFKKAESFLGQTSAPKSPKSA